MRAVDLHNWACSKDYGAALISGHPEGGQVRVLAFPKNVIRVMDVPEYALLNEHSSNWACAASRYGKSNGGVTGWLTGHGITNGEGHKVVGVVTLMDIISNGESVYRYEDVTNAEIDGNPDQFGDQLHAYAVNNGSLTAIRNYEPLEDELGPLHFGIVRITI